MIRARGIRSYTRVILLVWVMALLAGCARGRPVAARSTPRGQGPGTSDYWPTQGWRTATPEEQGMDSRRLAAMLAAVREGRLALHSLLVIRNGYIVSETYFPPYRQDQKHELYSCTKSFVATLVGVAVDQGQITGVDPLVLGFFPGRTFDNADERKETMKLEHLLTMTSGLDWHEGDPTYRAMYLSRDWVEYVLDKPMREQPGGRFNYCSGCSHVLAAILQRETDLDLREYARRYLFGPLGISDLRWETDASGIPIGGWGLQLTPRDMAKLGYLYLHDGVWDRQQIVSAEWIKVATQKHVATDGALGYGYQWWTYPAFGAYAALGRGGQTIFVVPHLNLIVVTTAGLEGHERIFQLIEDYIVPAAQGS